MFQEVLSEHLHSAGDIYHKKEMSFLGLTLALPGKDQLSQKDRLPLTKSQLKLPSPLITRIIISLRAKIYNPNTVLSLM